jgi:hypothetical protein
MPSNFIALSRSALYDLVWSTPVRDVAKDFGISDVALAKRCRALKIPLPPRGYWARVAAGQKPRRPALPPFAADRKRDSVPSYITTRDTEGNPTSEPAMTFDADRAAEKLIVGDAELPAVTVPASTDLAEACAIVKRTARHYKHARRAELALKRGEATGPVLRLAVSPDTLERALLFADTFLKAAAELTWSPIPPRDPEPPDPRHYYGRPPEPQSNPGPHYADLDVDGHRIEFAIEERFTLHELPPTQADLNRQKRESWFRPERRTEKIWSGRLRLKRPSHRYPYGIDGKSWFETENRRLGSLIPGVLADFRAVAARMQEVDEKIERERIERERQERLRKERAERRAANTELIHELERQAGAWQRARLLRRYLRAAKRAVGSDGYWVKTNDREVEFLSWAEHYLNQLDPLHAEARDPDLQHERSPYSYSSDEKRPQLELQRLIGHHWESTLKLVAAPSNTDDGPEIDDDDG